MSLVRFSPDEQFLAVVAGGGSLVVWELHLTASRLSKVGRERGGGGQLTSDLCLSQRLHVFSLLKESVVQDVVWEGKGGRLFYGDSLGRVAVASLPKVDLTAAVVLSRISLLSIASREIQPLQKAK